MKNFFGGLVLTLAITPAMAGEPAGQPQAERDVAVPMRDGVVLRADIYRPAGAGKFPVLVFRTPYGKHGAAHSDGIHGKAVARGYAVVMQDVRGRYASDGHFDPYRQERADGYDTIEWAARQAWSDGRVGTYGLSYPGAVQWLAALEAPPHLVAMAPAMTYSSPRRFFYMNGIFDRSWLPWIYENIAPDARRRRDQLQRPATGEKRAGPRAHAPRARPLGPWRALGDRRPDGRPRFRSKCRFRLRRFGARLPRPLYARHRESFFAGCPGALFRHGRQRVARCQSLAAPGGSHRDTLFGFKRHRRAQIDRKRPCDRRIAQLLPLGPGQPGRGSSRLAGAA